MLSVSGTLTGSATLALISPNETVAGSTVEVVFTAAPASSFPAPAAVTLAFAPLSKTWFDAVFTSADLICAGVNFGCACLTKAAAPATSPAAKLVPETPVYAEASYTSPFGS